MIIELEELIENAIQTSEGGTLSGSNAELGNLIGTFFSGIKSGLQNLFSGASAGSPVSGATLKTATTDLINGLPTLTPAKIKEAQDILSQYDTIIETLGSVGGIDDAKTHIEDIIKTDTKLKPIITTLKKLISFGNYDIDQSGFLNWKFISVTTSEGTSAEKDQTWEIETYATDIMQALEDLGYLSYEEKHITPTNFIKHGGNAAGIVINGVQDDSWVTSFLKAVNDVFSQYDNLLEYIEGEVRALIAATDKVISVPAQTGTTEGTTIDWGTLSEEEIEYLIEKLNLSLSLTKTIEEDEEEGKKKKRRKKLKKKKQKKTKNPKMIHSIFLETPSSTWIQSIEFRFPVKKEIKSDDRGTMTFNLKEGGSISKVRVKRGTFSVIAMWSLGTNFGVGYRYWSQFNKKAIVNKRKVFSWFIPIIKPQDRKIAIPMEIKEKMIKYK